MTWKSVVALLVALAIGGGLIAYGANQLSSGTVQCGGRTMARGDTCVETKNNSETKRSYDEQLDQSRQGNQIAIVIDALIVVGALGFTALGVRARRIQRRSLGQAAPSA